MFKFLSKPLPFAVLWLIIPALAPCAEETPLLRLNPNMHTDMINRVEISANQAVLATASDDKTVRLWALPEGRLFRTVRPYLGPGHEGKLFALALSSNGLQLATGGWTKGGYRGAGNHNVYLFSADNGELLNWLGGLDNSVLHLSFSPNGEYLAAALSGKAGIRVWRMANLTEVFRDQDSAGDCYWVEFAADNAQLASTCYDGKVRIYQHEANDKTDTFRLRQAAQIEQETQPFTARFAPDGTKLAVGFRGSPHAAILATDTLQALAWAKGSKGGKGDIFNVDWSLDGQYLYGGGSYQAGGKYLVLQWKPEGGRPVQHWPAGINTITALRATKNQRIVYADTSPGFGMLGDDGKPLINYHSETVAFNRAFPDGLLVSPGGEEIQFLHDTQFGNTGADSKATMRFSLRQRKLFEIVVETPPPTAPAPITTAVGPVNATGNTGVTLGVPSVAPPAVAAPNAGVPGKAESLGVAQPPTQPTPTPVFPVGNAAPAATNTTPSGEATKKRMTTGEAQEILRQQGYFPGAIDNILGPNTRTAIKTFQKARNLPTSGILDEPTVAALQKNTAPGVVETPPDPEATLSPPLLNAPGIELTNWRQNNAPRLNGKPLELDNYDICLSYAIAPNNDSLVLGTRFYLRRYGKDGKMLWKQGIPAIAWAVNITANGKLVVAALHDGTVRWYGLAEGEEWLALYPHADRRRWIAWTPRGQYAASVGADALLGWHINNKPNEAADFYPVRGLRREYYRPAALLTALRTAPMPPALDKSSELAAQPAHAKEGGKALDNGSATNTTDVPPALETALRQAQDTATPLADATATSDTDKPASVESAEEEADFPENLPPQIVILEPKDGAKFSTPQITLKYRMRFHGAQDPADVRILVNSIPWQTLKATQQANILQGEVQLELPPHHVELAVITENRHGVSPPKFVRLRWQNKQTALRQAQDTALRQAQDNAAEKGNLYVLAIGVGAYQDASIAALPQAPLDAQTFANLVKSLPNEQYREIVVKVLTNATHQQIMDSMEWLYPLVKPEDMTAVFIAGHAFTDKNGLYQFMPADADFEDNLISSLQLIDLLVNLPSKIIVFNDVAYPPTQDKALPDADAFANEFSSPENGVAVFSSTVGQQQAQLVPPPTELASALRQAQDTAPQAQPKAKPVTNDPSASSGHRKNEPPPAAEPPPPPPPQGAFVAAIVQATTAAQTLDPNQDSKLTLRELAEVASKLVSAQTKGLQTPVLAIPETVADVILHEY